MTTVLVTIYFIAVLIPQTGERFRLNHPWPAHKECMEVAKELQAVADGVKHLPKRVVTCEQEEIVK